MNSQSITQSTLYRYRYLLARLLIILLAAYGLFWRLGTMLPSVSRHDAEYLESLTTQSLAANPVYAPHKLLNMAVVSHFGVSIFNLRLTSVIFAAAALLFFYLLIKEVFRERIALVATILIATSSLWLGLARSASPEISVAFFTLAVIYLGKRANQHRSPLWLYALSLTLGLAFYQPYLGFLLLIASPFFFRRAKEILAEVHPAVKYSLPVLTLAVVAPVIYAAVVSQSVLNQLLPGLIDPPSISQYLANTRDVIAAFFWRFKTDWSFNLGSLPLLDIFSAVMIILGIYHLDRDISPQLTKAVYIGLAAAILLIALGGEPRTVALLLPFIYILIASGIVLLFSQWYEIFPRNPIARLTAFVPTILLIFAVIYYHHNRYFVAWPSTPEVNREYPASISAVAAHANAYSDREWLVYITPDEAARLRPISRLVPRIKITSVFESIVGQQNIIISGTAYSKLNRREQSKLGRLNPTYSSSSLNPVLIWSN